MARRFSLMVFLGVLGGAAAAHAECERFGTQLDCAVGANHVVIGTQVADDPTAAGWSIRPHSFHGGDRFLDDRPAPAQRFALQLQDIGRDPSLCRRIGNEGYCY